MTTQTDNDLFVEAWRGWHAAHERQRAHKHGFLAVSGLHWLDESPTAVPHAPGRWWTDDNGINVELGVGESIVVDGEVVTGTYRFGRIAERDSVYVDYGDAVIEVARRAGNDIIRPRHPNNQILADYRGTDTFEPTPEWVIEGRFAPFDEPRATRVGAAVEGLEHVYDARGTITFERDGQEITVVAFPGKETGLSLLFTDRTAGVSTYGLVRSIRIEDPGPDGSVILDFNRAVNLPCAYTPHATCPLPPEQNRLPFEVPAGERAPG